MNRNFILKKLFFIAIIMPMQLVAYTVTVRNLTNETVRFNLTGGSIPTTTMLLLPGHTIDVHTAGLCPQGIVVGDRNGQFWDEDMYSVIQCKEGLDWWIMRKDFTFANNTPLGAEKKGQYVVTRERPSIEFLNVKLRDGQVRPMPVYIHKGNINDPISPAYYGNDTNNPRGGVSKCYMGAKIFNIRSAADVFSVINDFKNRVTRTVGTVKSSFSKFKR